MAPAPLEDARASQVQEATQTISLVENEGDVPAATVEDTVFLTGVTGFIGRMTLRKLLLAGATVVVAIRGRRGQGATDRWNQMRDDDCFADLPLDKVEVIEADLLDPDFFESSAVEPITQRITRIVHVAASVNMDETVETALSNNLLPGIRLHQWARKCPRCSHVVITSTAFVNAPNTDIILEGPCPPPQGLSSAVSLSVSRLANTTLQTCTSLQLPSLVL